jgi:hypothetical protein
MSGAVLSLVDPVALAQMSQPPSADGTTFTVHSSPYTLPVVVTAPLVASDTVDALANAELTGKILLLHGTIAAEPLAPKRYPFYNPEEHQQIISLLERAQPAAIITASPRNPALAGALYPAPLFEDGDFAVPSAYMTVEDAARLAPRAGQLFQLQLACRPSGFAAKASAWRADRYPGRSQAGRPRAQLNVTP